MAPDTAAGTMGDMTEPMEPREALRKIVESAVAQTFPNVTVRQAREIGERVEKWLDQAGCEVIRRG